MAKASILVVDDEADIRELVSEILADEGYALAVAADSEQARALGSQQRFDLALLDIWMPGQDGVNLLRDWQQQADRPGQFIMMSGHATIETAVEATRLGAYDFIEKPISLAKLLLAVERALQASELQAENTGLKRRFLPNNEPVGRSAAAQRLREQLKRLAEHDTALLLQGEPGAGKQIAARYLHERSARARAPFTVLRAATLNDGNAEQQLYGRSDEGQLAAGLLARADGGTLFIDEISALPVAAQQGLRAALESRQYVVCGETEPRDLDVRVVAASSEPVEELVGQGRIDEQLYYQLNVVSLKIAPLRERREDVLDLINYYVDFFTSRDKLPPKRFDMAAQNRLRNHDWPGNQRELRNLVERLLVLSLGDEIRVEDVDEALARLHPEQTPQSNHNFDLPLREAREQFERDYLLYQLAQVDGRVGELAKRVGMERTHLYRKMRALDIDPKQFSERD